MYTAPPGNGHVRPPNMAREEGGKGDEMRILHASIMQICIIQAILICTTQETHCANFHRLVPGHLLVQICTMQSPIEIFQALEARRLELGLSQAEVGMRAFGRLDNAAFQALRRGSSPSVEKLSALCAAVGWELYFGPPREDLPVERITAQGDDFARVPVHDAFLAAGDGFANSIEGAVGYLAFKRTWLRRIGVPASVAVLVRAIGDSMAPTIHDGDMLLIDRSRSELPTRLRDSKDSRPAQIFAFLDDGAARVKRIEPAPGNSLALLSDNPAFAPEFRPLSSISIIGRVMWWGHTNAE